MENKMGQTCLAFCLYSSLYGQNKQAVEEIISSSLISEYVNRFNTVDDELFFG
jgi:hypothetical protein